MKDGVLGFLYFDLAQFIAAVEVLRRPELRCRTRYHRSLLTRVPNSAQAWVSTLVRTIFE